jgi:hypothetical protein
LSVFGLGRACGVVGEKAVVEQIGAGPASRVNNCEMLIAGRREVAPICAEPRYSGRILRSLDRAEHATAALPSGCWRAMPRAAWRRIQIRGARRAQFWVRSRVKNGAEATFTVNVLSKNSPRYCQRSGSEGDRAAIALLRSCRQRQSDR